MIGYITLGTNDLERAAAFYDQILAEIGAERVFELPRMIGWGTRPGKLSLGIIKPYDGQPATPGNGTMVALAAENPQQVQVVHAKALALGGKDEGPVGPREAVPGFYAGYFRDLDGNKLAVYCITKAA